MKPASSVANERILFGMGQSLYHPVTCQFKEAAKSLKGAEACNSRLVDWWYLGCTADGFDKTGIFVRLEANPLLAQAIRSAEPFDGNNGA
jgi:hypothetical protein